MLIDTHGLIWFLEDNSRMSRRALEVAEDQDTHLFVSLASLWEMAIKVRLGKLNLVGDYHAFVLEQLTRNDIEVLGISLEHVIQTASLPLFHRDPFDRLLVAQAIVENMPIISADMSLEAYPVTRIW
ncbi:MAG TPA: type II toxin-antitoxin system VapC family toxin [Thermomicrobiales bacterium]|nr:type II toxin-antitoxin system VapC family toxin [Thermomicrobiales bacterium]